LWLAAGLAACSKAHVPVGEDGLDARIDEVDTDHGDDDEDAMLAADARRDAGSDPDASLDAASDAARRPLPDAAHALDAARDAARDAAPVDAGIHVRGRLIGKYGVALSGFKVALDNQVVTSDSDGFFQFDGVQTPYDLAFRVEGQPGTSNAPELWVYRGLTRADPTLQADYTLGPQHRDLSVARGNLPIPADPDGGTAWVTEFDVEFGSPQASSGLSGASSGGELSSTAIYWFGADSLPGTLHALTWTRPQNALYYGRENVYLAYHTQPLVISSESTPSASGLQLPVDFTPNQVPVQTYRVRTEANWGASSDFTTVSGIIAFNSGANMWLVGKQVMPGEEVELTLPVLPDSKVAFYAYRQHPANLATCFGSAHRVAGAPDTTVELSVPEYRKLLDPPDSTSNVDASTAFAWDGAAGVSTLTFYCGARNHHVVSASQKEVLPTSAALGFALPRSTQCNWVVEVHGDYATTDDATHARGMIDPAGFVGVSTRGSMQRDGSLTRSEMRRMSTIP
jgi:hypothetical protein